jgi:hypothetical protein
MMLRNRAWAVLLLAALPFCFAGCGESASEFEPVPIEQQIRDYLGGVVKQGMLDSGIMWLDGALEEYQQEQPDKGQKLTAQLQELKQARGPQAVKAKAEAMLETLGPPAPAE